MYMSILGKPTDQDLDQYPHVLVTSPHEWAPSVTGYALPCTCGYPSWAPDPSVSYQHDPGLMNVAILPAKLSTLYPSFLTHLSLPSRSMFCNPQPLTAIN